MPFISFEDWTIYAAYNIYIICGRAFLKEATFNTWRKMLFYRTYKCTYYRIYVYTKFVEGSVEGILLLRITRPSGVEWLKDLGTAGNPFRKRKLCFMSIPGYNLYRGLADGGGW